MNYLTLCNLDDLTKVLLIEPSGDFFLRKMNPNRHFSFNATIKRMAKEIHKQFMVDKNQKDALDKLMKVVEDYKLTFHYSLNNPRTIKYYFQLHLKLIDPNSLVEIVKCTRFSGDNYNGVAIFAKKSIKKDTVLKYVFGVFKELTEQQEADLSESKQDFSIIYSTRSKKNNILLGPISYVNHDCKPNCKYKDNAFTTIHLQAIRNINEGEELLVSYGENYFGTNNQECQCKTCKNSYIVSTSLAKKRLKIDEVKPDFHGFDTNDHSSQIKKPTYNILNKQLCGTSINEVQTFNNLGQFGDLMTAGVSNKLHGLEQDSTKTGDLFAENNQQEDEILKINDLNDHGFENATNVSQSDCKDIIDQHKQSCDSLINEARTLRTSEPDFYGFDTNDHSSQNEKLAYNILNKLIQLCDTSINEVQTFNNLGQFGDVMTAGVSKKLHGLEQDSTKTGDLFAEKNQQADEIIKVNDLNEDEFMNATNVSQSNNKDIIDQHKISCDSPINEARTLRTLELDFYGFDTNDHSSQNEKLAYNILNKLIQLCDTSINEVQTFNNLEKCGNLMTDRVGKKLHGNPKINDLEPNVNQDIAIVTKEKMNGMDNDKFKRMIEIMNTPWGGYCTLCSKVKKKLSTHLLSKKHEKTKEMKKIRKTQNGSTDRRKLFYQMRLEGLKAFNDKYGERIPVRHRSTAKLPKKDKKTCKNCGNWFSITRLNAHENKCTMKIMKKK
ncbi:hypothetical protein TKK_0014633 [Trichogramma kaykai]|uniref:SET domain-containing protein n=1 Tax=Trichogramma kaykai TaxID=54128 RepID=A0ABD2WE82_9HYME